MNALRNTLKEIARSAGQHAQGPELEPVEVVHLRNRVRQLEVSLTEIATIAEDAYDGPEDYKWGAVLTECKHALGVKSW